MAAPSAFTMPGFAAGGRPPVGLPSMVGERGPELFVPDVAGTIVPNGRGPGGGGQSIVINQRMAFGSDVNRATLMTWGREIKRQTIGEIVEQKRRGSSNVGRAFA